MGWEHIGTIIGVMSLGASLLGLLLKRIDATTRRIEDQLKVNTEAIAQHKQDDAAIHAEHGEKLRGLNERIARLENPRAA